MSIAEAIGDGDDGWGTVPGVLHDELVGYSLIPRGSMMQVEICGETMTEFVVNVILHESRGDLGGLAYSALAD